MKRILMATDGSECANVALEKAIELAKLYESELTVLYVDEDPANKHVVTPAMTSGSPGMASGGAPGTVAGGVGTSAPLGAPVPVPDEDQTEETSDRAEKVLSNAKSRTTGLLESVTTISMTGDPADVIKDFVEESDIDLVVMGSSSKTGLKRFLLGSVADKVAKSIEKSVLIVR